MSYKNQLVKKLPLRLLKGTVNFAIGDKFKMTNKAILIVEQKTGLNHANHCRT